MNKELLQEFLPIVTKTKESILAGIEVLEKQVPQVVNEIFKWESSISVIGIVLGLIFIIIAIIIVKNWKKLWAIAYDKDNELGLAIGLIILSITGITMFIYNTCKMINILVAPRLYLLNYISGLLTCD